MRILVALSAVPSADRVLLAWAAALRAAGNGHRTLCIDAHPDGRLTRVCSPMLWPSTGRSSAGQWLAGGDALSQHSVVVRIRYVDRPFWARRGEVRLLPAGPPEAPRLRLQDGARLRARLREESDTPTLVVVDVPPLPDPAAYAAVAVADTVIVPLVVGAHADDELAVLHSRVRAHTGRAVPLYAVLVGTRRAPELTKETRARIEAWIRATRAPVTLSPFDVPRENRSVGREAAGFSQVDHVLAVAGLGLDPDPG